MKPHPPDDALLARAVAAIRASGHAGFLHVEEAMCVPFDHGFGVYVDDAVGDDVPPRGVLTTFIARFDGGELIGVTHYRARKRVDGRGWDTLAP